MSATTDMLASISTPDTVETRLGTLEFNDGAPTPETAERLYDHLDFMRGVEAFLNSIPGASLNAIRRGFLSVGVEDNQVLIFPELMDSASLFLTANSDTVYFWTFIDLAHGPMVIDVPAMPAPSAILGTIDDMWFRWVTDFGLPGPDRGEGGRYLLVGPGYDGPLPDSGFHVSHVRTTRATLIGRAFMIDNDPAPAVEAIKGGFRIYPYTPGALGHRGGELPGRTAAARRRRPRAGETTVRRRRAPGDQHDHAERLLVLGDDRRGRAAGAGRRRRSRDPGAARRRRDPQGRAVRAGRADARDPRGGGRRRQRHGTHAVDSRRASRRAWPTTRAPRGSTCSSSAATSS